MRPSRPPPARPQAKTPPETTVSAARSTSAPPVRVACFLHALSVADLGPEFRDCDASFVEGQQKRYQR